MDTSPWNLELELCNITNSSNLASALHTLGIIDTPTDFYQIRTQPEWVRGGAETYIYRFWVETTSRNEKGIIVKACISLANVEDTIKKWIMRRNLIHEYKIATPILYYYGNGLIIEELIPFKLSQQLILSDDKKLKKIIVELSEFAGCLTNLGFSPLDAFSDLMSHGDDVVPVDFGQDLGPPNMTNKKDDHLFEELLKTFSKWSIQLESNLIDVMRKHYRFTARIHETRLKLF